MKERGGKQKEGRKKEKKEREEMNEEMVRRKKGGKGEIKTLSTEKIH